MATVMCAPSPAWGKMYLDSSRGCCVPLSCQPGYYPGCGGCIMNPQQVPGMDIMQGSGPATAGCPCGTDNFVGMQPQCHPCPTPTKHGKHVRPPRPPRHHVSGLGAINFSDPKTLLIIGAIGVGLYFFMKKRG